MDNRHISRAVYFIPLALLILLLLFARNILRKNELLLASQEGDTGKVARLLRQGVDVNGSLGGTTPLMIASVKGHAETVRLLLNRGAQVDSRSLTGWTSLMKAIDNVHADVVKALIAGGANVNIRTRHWTPLSLAEKKLRNHEGEGSEVQSIVDMLKKAGAKE